LQNWKIEQSELFSHKCVAVRAGLPTQWPVLWPGLTLQKSPIGQSKLFSQKSALRAGRPTQWPILLPWLNLTWQKLPLGQSELSSQNSCLGAAEELVGKNGTKTAVKAAKARTRIASIRSL
jgi:hypothetical protein